MTKPRNPRLTDLIRTPGDRSSEDVPPSPEPTIPAPASEASGTPAPSTSSDLDAPSFDEIPRGEETTEAEATRLYGALASRFATIFADARKGAFDPTDLDDAVRGTLSPTALLDALFAETFKQHDEHSFLEQKSVNVMVYALRLGRSLSLRGPGLVELGTAAFLHKVGLARVPEDLLLKSGSLTRRERSQIQGHPEIGRDLVLESLGPRGQRIAEIVFQAHERVDGTGYPRGLRGDQIQRKAMVIGLVDVYEALIQPRPYRERLMPFAAVKEMIERERSRFPRELVREFISSFSVFPPYTYVRLNSNAIARVVGTEPGHPLRPTVRIVLDPRGRHVSESSVLRLRDSPLLYITGPVDQESLPG